MIFNLFYQDLIEELNKMNCGIRIGAKNFNLYCYADDILLSSTTVTGLQSLIDVAVNNITKNGLRFNPSKTECMIVGGNPFIKMPTWTIHKVPLSTTDNLKYQGTQLSDLS
jgi:hypothetical protein